MLGSPNLHRGNVPLAMRLRIYDLHAQLAPLERYGVGGDEFGHSRRRCARFVRAVGGAFSCGAFYRAQCRGRLSAPDFAHLGLRP